MKTGQLPEGSFTLDQLLTFKTSSNWAYNQDEFRAIVILLDKTMPALLRVEVESHDIPEWIAADRLDYYMQLPEGEYRAEDTACAGIEERVFSYFVETEGGNLMLLWKRGMVLGDYFRIASFGLQVPSDKWDTPEVAVLKEAVLDSIATLTFSPQVMPTDRIAPTPKLKQTSVSTVLRFRVPGPWTRGKQDEWTVYDSGDRNLGVFEARFDWFPLSRRPDVESRERILFLLDRDHPGLKDAKDWLVFKEIDDSFTPPELTLTFRRLFFRGEWDILDVWFCYRVVATRADAPAVRDLIDLFTREVHQAVVSFPEEDLPAPGGR